jgi:nucleotide-binding universal stress UspA family protein
MHIYRILVPTDFSVVSEHALQQACALAKQAVAPLLLLHVIPPLADAWTAVLWAKRE